MSPPSPTYKQFHEALKEELSPRRVVAGSPREKSPRELDDEIGRQMSLEAIDRDVKNQPNVFHDPGRALDALLVLRDSVATQLKKNQSDTRESVMSKFCPPTAAIPPPVRDILSNLSEPQVNIASLGESEDALPTVANSSPRREKLIAYNSLSNSECANINASRIMSHRPWLTNNQKSDPQSAAAAHLLMYAEGMQNIREHLTATEGSLKVGCEVTISPEFFSGDGGGMKTGIVAAFKSEFIATVHIQKSHSDPKGQLEVDVNTKYLRAKTRRIVPIEALEKWGSRGREIPSIAAHTKYQSPSSVGKYISTVSDCRHILNAIDEPASIPNHVSCSSSKTDGFTLRDTSFHVREVAGGCLEGENARYRQLVSMISKSVLIVDNPNFIKQSCDNCYDKNVDPGVLINYCGRAGRVVQVNSAADTARLAFRTAHVWVPISVITLCNSDPMSSIGCRNTTISVLGNPSKSELLVAAKAIAKREDEKWKLRKKEREKDTKF